MKLITFLEATQSILRFVSQHDIKSADCLYIDMYHDFIKMRDNHEKYDYAIAVLSDKYKISKSKIKRLLHKFSQEI